MDACKYRIRRYLKYPKIAQQNKQYFEKVLNELCVLVKVRF